MNATPSSIAVRSVPTQGRCPDRQRGNCTVLLGELFSDSATAAIFLPRRPQSRETSPIPHSFFRENAFWASRSQLALPDVLHLQIFSLKLDSPAQNPALQMWRVQCGPRGATSCNRRHSARTGELTANPEPCLPTKPGLIILGHVALAQNTQSAIYTYLFSSR